MPKRTNFARIAEKCIRKLVSEFQNNPYNFFSEGDVKCSLFRMLFDNKEIKKLKKTIDGQFISSLHSEISYFDDEGKLLLRVDLSGVDPEDTHVFRTSKKSGIKLAGI